MHRLYWLRSFNIVGKFVRASERTKKIYFLCEVLNFGGNLQISYSSFAAHHGAQQGIIQTGGPTFLLSQSTLQHCVLWAASTNTELHGVMAFDITAPFASNSGGGSFSMSAVHLQRVNGASTELGKINKLLTMCTPHLSHIVQGTPHVSHRVSACTITGADAFSEHR